MPKKKTKKPMLQKRFKRTVKQQATLVNSSHMEIVEELTKRIQRARHYMYSRLAGINSYFSLQNPKGIRNEWMKDKKLVEQFRLPARFWKITLEEVVSSLKSLWSNACNKIKEAAKENHHLTDDEKFYIRYVCSAPPLFGAILTRQPIVRPKKLEELKIRENYIHSLINRYARRYRGKTPYSHSKTFQLDADMYKYIKEDGVVYLDMSTHLKGERIRLRCSDQHIFRKTSV